MRPNCYYSPENHEGIKRAREESQLSSQHISSMQPCRKAFRSMRSLYYNLAPPTAAPPIMASAASTTAFSPSLLSSSSSSLLLKPSASQAGRSDPLRGTDDEGGRSCLTAGPASVEIIRGDTGRRINFYLQPFITYEWRRRNEFYESLTGEAKGFELRETVRTRVMYANNNNNNSANTNMMSSSYYNSSYNIHNNEDVQFVAAAADRYAPPAFMRCCNEEESEDESASCRPQSLYHLGCESPDAAAALPCREDHHHPHHHAINAGGGGGGGGGFYFYEASATSRVLNPPEVVPHNSTNNTNKDPKNWLCSSTASLLVQCVLKCTVEEALIEDSQSWVFLYRGRPLVSECGQQLLATDLLKQALAAVKPNPPLSICVFRKF